MKNKELGLKDLGKIKAHWRQFNVELYYKYLKTKQNGKIKNSRH